jgi:hypothetical protein
MSGDRQNYTSLVEMDDDNQQVILIFSRNLEDISPKELNGFSRDLLCFLVAGRNRIPFSTRRMPDILADVMDNQAQGISLIEEEMRQAKVFCNGDDTVEEMESASEAAFIDPSGSSLPTNPTDDSIFNLELSQASIAPSLATTIKMGNGSQSNIHQHSSDSPPVEPPPSVVTSVLGMMESTPDIDTVTMQSHPTSAANGCRSQTSMTTTFPTLLESTFEFNDSSADSSLFDLPPLANRTSYEFSDDSLTEDSLFGPRRL